MGFLGEIKKVFTKTKEKAIDGANEVIGGIIPGYDYREKTARLNTDVAVRDKLSRELKKAHATLKEIGALAYRDERRDILDHLEDTVETLDVFRMEVENAEYGISPFFKEENMDDAGVRRMIEFDAQMFDELEVITKASELLYDGTLDGKTSDFIIQLRKIKRSADSARNQFKNRRDFLINIA